jgi:hypothetical protein
VMMTCCRGPYLEPKSSNSGAKREGIISTLVERELMERWFILPIIPYKDSHVLLVMPRPGSSENWDDMAALQSLGYEEMGASGVQDLANHACRFYTKPK